jgi:hypothetical protein
MGGEIVGPDVGLDLDDPAGAQAAVGLDMDQTRPDEGAGSREGRRREGLASEGQLRVRAGSGRR